ncbi:MAG: CotH kinase family protein, partial [Polyangiales bacterium]
SDADAPLAPAADASTQGSATHGDSEPDYALVFADDRVHTIYITLAATDYQRMEDNLAELLPNRGAGGPGGPPGGGVPALPVELTEACVDLAEGEACEAQGAAGTCTKPPFAETLLCLSARGPGGMPGGGMGPGGGAINILREDPIYVDAEIRYEGLTWSHVGMRYKGNSSIASSVGSGIKKLPFRLDFDEYEDIFPETKNQRFHGFKKLTFSSNWNDASQLRDTLVAEIMRDRGIPAARCAFYRVFVDSGAGDTYWGLYTMIEDPADGAMLEAQLGSKDGNLYKPDGVGADWTQFSEEGFVKKNNDAEADYADVQNAVAALLADQTDPATWRTNLETYFDAEHFIRWLAINTVVENWDAYGAMAHNYYLYGDPSDAGRLKWLPWDHNLSLSTGGGFGPGRASGDIFHSDAGARWPLISRLLADPVYAPLYRAELLRSLEGAFAVAAMNTRMHTLHDLVAPYVVGAEGEQAPFSNLASAAAFEDSVDGDGQLLQHISERHSQVMSALEE